VLLGSGNDVVQWGPGDGNDSVEGETGSDRIEFSGSSIAEALEVAGSGERVVLTRNIASVTMDFGGVETLALRPLAGADTITVDDTTGTDLAVVDANLEAVTGTGDGAQDTVITNGTLCDWERVRSLGVDQFLLNMASASPESAVSVAIASSGSRFRLKILECRTRELTICAATLWPLHTQC